MAGFFRLGTFGLGRGSSRRWPDSASLVLDFVPDGDDTDWVNLDLNFTSQTYQANADDASVPSGTFINILVWS